MHLTLDKLPRLNRNPSCQVYPSGKSRKRLDLLQKISFPRLVLWIGRLVVGSPHLSSTKASSNFKPRIHSSHPFHLDRSTPWSFCLGDSAQCWGEGERIEREKAPKKTSQCVFLPALHFCSRQNAEETTDSPKGSIGRVPGSEHICASFCFGCPLDCLEGSQ